MESGAVHIRPPGNLGRLHHFAPTLLTKDISLVTSIQPVLPEAAEIASTAAKTPRTSESFAEGKCTAAVAAAGSSAMTSPTSALVTQLDMPIKNTSAAALSKSSTAVVPSLLPQFHPSSPEFKKEAKDAALALDGTPKDPLQATTMGSLSRESSDSSTTTALAKNASRAAVSSVSSEHLPVKLPLSTKASVSSNASKKPAMETTKTATSTPSDFGESDLSDLSELSSDLDSIGEDDADLSDENSVGGVDQGHSDDDEDDGNEGGGEEEDEPSNHEQMEEVDSEEEDDGDDDDEEEDGDDEAGDDDVEEDDVGGDDESGDVPMKSSHPLRSNEGPGQKKPTKAAPGTKTQRHRSIVETNSSSDDGDQKAPDDDSDDRSLKHTKRKPGRPPKPPSRSTSSSFSNGKQLASSLVASPRNISPSPSSLLSARSTSHNTSSTNMDMVDAHEVMKNSKISNGNKINSSVAVKEEKSQESDSQGKRKRKQMDLLNIRKRDRSGRTPLFKYTASGDIEQCRLLIEAGAEVNIKDNADWTPLHEACVIGHDNVAELLIQHHADVNAAGGHLDTPLHDAAQNGHVKVVELLLKYGANVTAKNAKGVTPLDVCEDDEVIDLLEKRQQQVNHISNRNQAGQTVLHRACASGSFNNVVEYLNQGADVHALDNAHWTPLHEAALKGHYEIVELLLQKGARPNARGHGSDTALHDAAQNEHVSVVELLIKFGADPTLKNTKGRIPADVTTNRTILKLLQQDHGNSNGMTNMQQSSAAYTSSFKEQSSNSTQIPNTTGSSKLQHRGHGNASDQFRSSEIQWRNESSVDSKMSDRSNAQKEHTPVGQLSREERKIQRLLSSIRLREEMEERRVAKNRRAKLKSDDDEHGHDNDEEDQEEEIKAAKEKLKRKGEKRSISSTNNENNRNNSEKEKSTRDSKDNERSKDKWRSDSRSTKKKQPYGSSVSKLSLSRLGRQQTMSPTLSDTEPDHMVSLTSSKPQLHQKTKSSIRSSGLDVVASSHTSSRRRRKTRLDDRESSSSEAEQLPAKKTNVSSLPSASSVAEAIVTKPISATTATTSSTIAATMGSFSTTSRSKKSAVQRSLGDRFRLDHRFKDSDGRTQLHRWVEAGDIEMVGTLLEGNVDCNAADNEGLTPLHLAAKLGKTDVLGLLLAYGAQVNTKDGSGSTALHLAVKYHHVSSVDLLLKRAAKVDVVDGRSKTCWDLVSIKHHPEIASLLRQAMDQRETRLSEGAKKRSSMSLDVDRDNTKRKERKTSRTSDDDSDERMSKAIAESKASKNQPRSKSSTESTLTATSTSFKGKSLPAAFGESDSFPMDTELENTAKKQRFLTKKETLSEKSYKMGHSRSGSSRSTEVMTGAMISTTSSSTSSGSKSQRQIEKEKEKETTVRPELLGGGTDLKIKVKKDQMSDGTRESLLDQMPASLPTLINSKNLNSEESEDSPIDNSFSFLGANPSARNLDPTTNAGYRQTASLSSAATASIVSNRKRNSQIFNSVSGHITFAGDMKESDTVATGRSPKETSSSKVGSTQRPVSEIFSTATVSSLTAGRKKQRTMKAESEPEQDISSKIKADVLITHSLTAPTTTKATTKATTKFNKAVDMEIDSETPHKPELRSVQEAQRYLPLYTVQLSSDDESNNLPPTKSGKEAQHFCVVDLQVQLLLGLSSGALFVRYPQFFRRLVTSREKERLWSPLSSMVSERCAAAVKLNCEVLPPECAFSSRSTATTAISRLKEYEKQKFLGLELYFIRLEEVIEAIKCDYRQLNESMMTIMLDIGYDETEYDEGLVSGKEGQKEQSQEDSGVVVKTEEVEVKVETSLSSSSSLPYMVKLEHQEDLSIRTTPGAAFPTLPMTKKAIMMMKFPPATTATRIGIDNSTSTILSCASSHLTPSASPPTSISAHEQPMRQQTPVPMPRQPLSPPISISTDTTSPIGGYVHKLKRGVPPKMASKSNFQEIDEQYHLHQRKRQLQLQLQQQQL